MSNDLPDMLTSYSAFQQHIEGQLKDKQGHDKGDPWQEFARKLIPLTEFGKQFSKIKDNPKKTRDKGWDIRGENPDNDKTELYIQAKFRVPDQNELDGIISSFVPLAGIPEGQLVLQGVASDSIDTKFCIVTISDLHSSIISRYSQSRVLKPSAVIYNQWVSEDRIEIVDGPVIWKLFRDRYLKAFAQPGSQTLKFESAYTKFESVYLGIVAASEIRRIYASVGDAIFFENVRDFEGSTDVNKEISRTITTKPWQFLPLNNGIVFSAYQIEEDKENILKLDRATIVNGCQTTMSLVKTEPLAGQDCYVQVKIVKVDEQSKDKQWDVTHAANYQNEINRIDLDLAKYVRPQLVKKQGWLTGVQVSDESDIWSILDTFNDYSVEYKNIRILFIGLFSREPGNMFDVRFDLVNGDLLEHYFQDDKLQRYIFDVIFGLHIVSERSSKAVKQWLTSENDEETLNLFARLLGDTRAPYVQYLAILALCALVNMNIAERDINKATLIEEVDWMEKFLLRLSRILQGPEKDVDFAFALAFEKVAANVLNSIESSDKGDVRTAMHNRITKKDTFTKLFRNVKLALNTAKHGRDLYGDAD